ncbi:MAG: peptide deformylase [Planctomycetes bacterium]|nr:peptide deformylase [Planctomycetota bacterium]
MGLKMVFYPDPRLREVSKAVMPEDMTQIRETVPRMFEVMYRQRGVGLAGPQVGFMRRIIVANLTADPQNKAEEKVFLNPQIRKKSGSMFEDEGCLSLPGITAKIRRAAGVKAVYFDVEGQMWEVDCEGLCAKLFQHEIDHLDGVLMIDKMSAADIKQFKPLLRELEEDYKAKREPKHRRNAVPTEL